MLFFAFGPCWASQLCLREALEAAQKAWTDHGAKELGIAPEPAATIAYFRHVANLLGVVGVGPLTLEVL